MAEIYTMLGCAIVLVVLLVVAFLAGIAVRRWRASYGPDQQEAIQLSNRITGGATHLDKTQALEARRRFLSESNSKKVLFLHGPSFLFYNVHEYANTFGVDQKTDIVKLIARAAQEGAEFVGLAEAAPDANAREALAPFPHSLMTNNGGTRLAVAWNDPLANASVVPTTGSRNCIMLATQQHRIIVVHLEIGARPRPDNEPDSADFNRKTRANNSAERIRQLEILTALEPDILIGDFNFGPGEPEDVWIQAHGYKLVSGREPSTPFNRVDHCYVQKALAGAYRPADSSLLPVSYSDHRPLVQVLK